MKLKLGQIPDDKPVKVSLELPASLHRDLVTYAEILGRENNQSPTDPARLIVPMLERFMAADRGFAKARRATHLNRAHGTAHGSMPESEPSPEQG